jgi:glutamyl/glutaminyl-tRNA synthetase
VGSDAETTIFTREQAIAVFDLANVSKNPAAFDRSSSG